METNLAYTYEETWRVERIGGKLVAIAPAAINHDRVKGNIFGLFWSALKNRTCEALPDGAAVFLTETDYYIPDGMVICEPDKIRPDGVYGAPDLVVEVLSPSTARFDKGRKKDVYETCGVKEYWIVDPASKSVEQYLLSDGRFVLRDVYYAEYPDWMLAHMSETERAAIATEFKCNLYDDVIIRLEDIFARVP